MKSCKEPARAQMKTLECSSIFFDVNMSTESVIDSEFRQPGNEHFILVVARFSGKSI